MALPVRDQVKYWGLAAAVFLVVLWVLGDVILPFVLGAAIAYFLDPVADRLERAGCSRAVATGIITVFALLIFVLLALLVIPTLVSQTADLIETAPAMLQNLQAVITERFPEIGDSNSTIRRSLATIAETIQSKGGEVLNTILGSFSGVVNALVLFVIVPVVAFYLLLDWDRMVARIDALLPRDHAPTIRKLASDIDSTMAGFIRGQGTVCLILGAYYAVALMLVGLNFGLVVGFVAGALTFIPYVGALVGGILAIGLALFQFWGDWLWIVLVWAIFQSGQFVEGNILTPKLVGESVGLHPVWLIFALSAFGALFGFVGLLVAVPVAAAIGVITRFAIEQYKDSRLYRGLSDQDDA
ncbi:AI-2E family transporter [Alphaproteobacteria bacterium GH1-50]|uniref:AI-2E family transporter n=1 Tax=Kangsaoukella pontilimi TaxID=2691042 RepID=A0A7C9ISR4_9RHOB|nr:AI-2E family transporter [Kangsaoukella pontilimi]MXQ08846.1 AI-2E family transporter [Kangsaoukella pontilimi]